MQFLDYIFIALYFCVVAGIGYWSSRTSLENSDSYFLGGRTIGWMAIGASLFSSNISSEHFIGLAGSGASSGLAVGQFEWLACLILLLLGWFFAPFYLKTGIFTMPEFLEKRYNSGCRNYLSIISLIAYIFTKISVALYAGALVLQVVLGWDIWIAAVILIIATGAYTIFGGLRAVIYTDFFQAGILILGGIVLTGIAITKAGITTMTQQVPEFFNLWKSINHPEFPWTGILFGAPILGIWYWCTDQMIVQRTLATQKVEEARRATIFAGFLKILPVFILVLPGIAGHILYPEVEPNKIYAHMVINLLPIGIKGLVIAALLAALMSSLSAVFNSSSTLVVMDFYKKRHPEATEKQLVRCGQIATAVLVVAGLAWIPFIGMMSNQIYLYLQSVQAYISPPIAAIFLIGLLWKRINGKGAFCALITGFVLGALRFICELSFMRMIEGKRVFVPGFLSQCGICESVIQQFTAINFLHFAVLLFVISVVVMSVVSLLTNPPKAANLEVFDKAASVSIEEKASLSNILLSVALVITVLVCWFIFSPIFFKG